MIEIDGRHGGGQLLRTALSLSAATKKPFRILNIRGKREESGIKPQHLAAISAMKELCDADVEGNFKGSHELIFVPHAIEKRELSIDIGTAGSATLVLQTVIPSCLDKEMKIIVRGGTDTLHCPGSHYFANVFCDFLRKIGLKIDFNIGKYGFYPKGGGELSLTIEPSVLDEICFVERGKLLKMELYAAASEDLKARDVTKRLVNGFRSSITTDIGIDAKQDYVKTLSAGCFVHSNAHYENYKIGDDALGERDVRAEDVGKNCALKMNKLLRKDGVDHYAADQLMVYMAIKGKGMVLASELTDHVKTNAAVIERFLPVKFTFENNLITCGPVV